MGFNAAKPGKVKRADLLYLGAALVVVTVLIVWVIS
jgi:hypothetical protein